MCVEPKILQGSNSIITFNKENKIEKELFDSDSSSLNESEEVVESDEESNEEEVVFIHLSIDFDKTKR